MSALGIPLLPWTSASVICRFPVDATKNLMVNSDLRVVGMHSKSLISKGVYVHIDKPLMHISTQTINNNYYKHICTQSCTHTEREIGFASKD